MKEKLESYVLHTKENSGLLFIYLLRMKKFETSIDRIINEKEIFFNNFNNFVKYFEKEFSKEYKYIEVLFINNIPNFMFEDNNWEEIDVNIELLESVINFIVLGLKCNIKYLSSINDEMSKYIDYMFCIKKIDDDLLLYNSIKKIIFKSKLDYNTLVFMFLQIDKYKPTEQPNIEKEKIKDIYLYKWKSIIDDYMKNR